jgi:hypothetical protein
MKTILLSFALLLQCLFVAAQATDTFSSFIKSHFKKTALPKKVECNDVISDENPGYEFISYLDDFPYYTDTANQVSKEEFDFLFQAVDTLYGYNIWSFDTCCNKSKNAFYDAYLLYPGSYFEIGENILGFVIWIVDNDGINKVLYTADRKGKLLGKLPLAFYNRHGTYTTDDGGRGIWWTARESVIRSDLSIETHAKNHRTFQVLKNGKIKEK